jgi:hypothetical protein
MLFYYPNEAGDVEKREDFLSQSTEIKTAVD